MTEQEKINVDTQRQLALQDAKFNAFVDEMRDFKQEMRDRDNQRAEDIREIRSTLDAMSKHFRSITITTMVGVGTSVIAVVVLVGTVAYSMFMR